MSMEPQSACFCRTTADIGRQGEISAYPHPANPQNRHPTLQRTNIRHSSGQKSANNDPNWFLSMRKDYALFPRGKLTRDYATIASLMGEQYSYVYARRKPCMSASANQTFSENCNYTQIEPFHRSFVNDGENPELVCMTSQDRRKRAAQNARSSINNEELLSVKNEHFTGKPTHDGFFELPITNSISITPTFEHITPTFGGDICSNIKLTSIGCSTSNLPVVAKLTQNPDGRIMINKTKRKSVIEIHGEMLKAYSQVPDSSNNCDNFDVDSLNEVVIVDNDELDEIITSGSDQENINSTNQRKTSSDSNFVSDFSSDEDGIDFDSLEVIVQIEPVNINHQTVPDIAAVGVRNKQEETSTDSQNITPRPARRKRTTKRRKRRQHENLFASTAGGFRNRSRSECMQLEATDSSDQGYDSFGKDQFYSDVPYLHNLPSGSSLTHHTELRRAHSVPPSFRLSPTPSSKQHKDKNTTPVSSNTSLHTANKVITSKAATSEIPATTDKSENDHVYANDNSKIVNAYVNYNSENVVTYANDNLENADVIISSPVTAGEASSTIARNSHHYSVIDIASSSYSPLAQNQLNNNSEALPSTSQELKALTALTTSLDTTSVVSPLKCITSEEFIPYVCPTSPYAFTQPVPRAKPKPVRKVGFQFL